MMKLPIKKVMLSWMNAMLIGGMLSPLPLMLFFISTGEQFLTLLQVWLLIGGPPAALTLALYLLTTQTPVEDTSEKEPPTNFKGWMVGYVTLTIWAIILFSFVAAPHGGGAAALIAGPIIGLFGIAPGEAIKRTMSKA